MLSALIGAAASLIGGAQKRRAQEETNRMAQAQADKNIALQKEFAQHGLRWKVEDAKAAGISPLYAVGAPATSFAPVSVGYEAPTGLGEGFASAGQDISRAINATRTSGERDAAFASTYAKLQLQNAELQNELLGAQIAKLRAGINPPFPSGEVPVVESAGRPPLKVLGYDLPSSGGTSSADDFQFRYGEPGEWLSAPLILWDDLTHEGKKMTREEAFQAGMEALSRGGF